MEERLEHLVERKGQAVIESLAGISDKHAVVTGHCRQHIQKGKVEVSNRSKNIADYGSGQVGKGSVDWKAHLNNQQD